MKKYLILHKPEGIDSISPYLHNPEQDNLCLYAGQAIDLMINGTKSKELLLCKSQEGNKIYTVTVKNLPSNMVEFDIKVEKLVTGEAWFALKVFALKCKLVSLSQIARQQYGEKQEEMWHKLIGLMEPILCGGWM